jgi:hypothetical protein
MKFKNGTNWYGPFLVLFVAVGVCSFILPTASLAKVECSDGSGIAEGDPGDGDDSMGGGGSSSYSEAFGWDSVNLRPSTLNHDYTQIQFQYPVSFLPTGIMAAQEHLVIPVFYVGIGGK